MPPILWTDRESDYLIHQRHHRNDEFHNISREEVRLDFGRVLQEGLIEGFVEGGGDTRIGNANKNGEIWFATIQ